MIYRIYTGHHGTRLETAKAICAKHAGFDKGQSSADWLGTGSYFWCENQPRAIEWSRNSSRNFTNRAVIEAQIVAKNVLDVNLSYHQEIIRQAFSRIEEEALRGGFARLRNTVNENGKIIERRLDCTVIDEVNNYLKRHGQTPYDVCVGVFEDGDEIFPGAAIRDKSHTQLCVIDSTCIKNPQIVWSERS